MHKSWLPSSTSREKRFCILPVGVVSKKCIGLCIIFLNSSLWRWLEALSVTYNKPDLMTTSVCYSEVLKLIIPSTSVSLYPLRLQRYAALILWDLRFSQWSILRLWFPGRPEAAPDGSPVTDLTCNRAATTSSGKLNDLQSTNFQS